MKVALKWYVLHSRMLNFECREEYFLLFTFENEEKCLNLAIGFGPLPVLSKEVVMFSHIFGILDCKA